jgi:hypothetical protein
MSSEELLSLFGIDERNPVSPAPCNLREISQIVNDWRTPNPFFPDKTVPARHSVGAFSLQLLASV